MKINRKEVVSVVLGLALLTGSSGCGMLSSPTEREQSAGVGALAGGVGGAIIGSFTGAAVTGGLFGMPLGALAGYYIGDQWLRDRSTREARNQEADRELAQLRQENERLKRLAESSEQASGSASAKSEQPATTATPANVTKSPPDNVMVGFDLNKSSLDSTAQQTLSPVVAWLEDDSDRNVAVVGYTDSTGSDSYNIKLAERRAKAVRDFLLQSGVSGDRITTRGMGKANPIAANDTQTGREKNRRVEVISNANAAMRTDSTRRSN
ncbi:MAG: OmpA family protein [Candidatus Binatia bacterium]